MNDDGLIKDVAGLSKPTTVFIEKISDAIGGIVKPYQIKRVAKAEAEAELIKTEGKIKSAELQQRAFHRLIDEEAKHQANMELITEKAIGYLEDDAKPEKMENDWISNFFDKCRLVSDEQMQTLWAKLLAGEANEPGKYSKRTVNFVASMDKHDAMLFTKLCSFVWSIGTQFVCLIGHYSWSDEIYGRNGIDFYSLMHLDTIGLITFGAQENFYLRDLPPSFIAHYHDSTVRFTFPRIMNGSTGEIRQETSFETGCVLLSQIGKELVPIAGSEAIPEFVDYVIDVWTKKGYKVTRDRPLEEEKKT